MSRPRKTVPGGRYILCRRTSQRQFMLRPDGDGEFQRAFLYCLAVAKHGIRVVAVCCMSTHYHAIVEDPHGTIVDFYADFHHWVTCVTLCLRGHSDDVWDRGQTSCVDLKTPEAFVEQYGYLAGNPVEAGAVKEGRRWPGVWTGPDQLGRARYRLRRPAAFFRDEDKFPKVLTLKLELPKVMVTWAGGEGPVRAKLGQAAAQHEERARATMRKQGRRFLGARRCTEVDVYPRATKYEAWGRRNPTFATGGVPGAYRKAVEELREFRARYRAAFERWRSGERDVLFPRGTFKMARVHPVAVDTT